MSSAGGALAALLLLLSGCRTAEAPDRGRLSAEQPATLAQRLPEAAAGFLRGSSAPVPDADGGVEVAYATRGREAAGATVTLLPRPAPPGGAAGPAEATPAETEAALDALVREATRPQPSRRTGVRGERFVLPAEGAAAAAPGTAPRLRCVETAGSFGRERVEGLVCAGTLPASRLHLRVSMPQREPPAADARGFAAAIAAALTAPAPAAAAR
jgi:hypothetical protein